MSILKRDYGSGYYEFFPTREKPNSQRNHNRLTTLLERRREGSLLEIGCGKGGFLTLAER
jgi:cyclopropane fatty-acyl-phospholipid synthase-like methyltransferase